MYFQTHPECRLGHCVVCFRDLDPDVVAKAMADFTNGDRDVRNMCEMCTEETKKRRIREESEAKFTELKDQVRSRSGYAKAQQSSTRTKVTLSIIIDNGGMEEWEQVAPELVETAKTKYLVWNGIESAKANNAYQDRSRKREINRALEWIDNGGGFWITEGPDDWTDGVNSVCLEEPISTYCRRNMTKIEPDDLVYVKTSMDCFDDGGYDSQGMFVVFKVNEPGRCEIARGFKGSDVLSVIRHILTVNKYNYHPFALMGIAERYWDSVFNPL